MQDHGASSNEEVLVFGPFQLFRARKILLEADRPVRLGSRALDILVALVERAGEVVGKNELMACAWPSTFVEESNLRVHVAALRKVLGDGQAGVRYIVNIAGRGYCFVAPVTRTRTPQPAQPAPADPGRSPQLPAPLMRAVGRDDAVHAIAMQVPRRRFVTVVGPGGIGKSTVVLAVAEQLVDSYPQRACFVDLAAVDDPLLVPAALATVIGVSVRTEDPVASLVAFLRGQRMLIVLDNCEHVLATAAHLVESILKEAPGVDVLATSREPLLAEGEWLHRLPPLEAPPDRPGLTAAEAARFSAVQLFVERAANSVETFELTDANACVIAGICRRLDGVPLAIELAAARVDLLGVEGLAARLDDRFLLITRGRRTAQPRHQSLRATLDWSFEMLSSDEQLILRRLAVFRGAFTLESATAVVAAGDVTPPDVLDGIMSLAARSLVTTDVSGQAVHHRLLHITRAYAIEKLVESGEQQAVLRRHAEHFRSLLEVAQADWDVMARSEWLARYGNSIDDVRTALDWAFGEDGDVSIGASLTAASLPFGFQLSLIDEFKQRAERALDSLSRVSPPQAIPELRLNVALGVLHWNTSPDEERVSAAFDRAIALSERIDIAKYRIEPLTTKAVFHLELGNYSAAVANTDRLSDIARSSDDPLAVLSAERAAAQANHFAGDHDRARVLADRVLRHPAKVIPLTYSQTSVDRRVSMRIVLARILWIDGYPDQATDMAAETVEMASSDGPFAICQALGLAACPIAFWRGDLAEARRLTANLLEYSRRYTLNRWQTLGACFHAIIERRTSDRTRPGPAAPYPTLARPASRLQGDLLATVTEDRPDMDTLRRAELGACGWCTPEVLRVSSLVHLDDDRPGSLAAAEMKLVKALDVARAQRALSWELRAATTLAQLLRRQRRDAQAAAQLRATYDRFTEGRGTVDHQRAREVLEELVA